MLPKAEFVHWWFATGFLIIGLLLLAEAFVGEEAWGRRPWRPYLWPSFAFVMGVLPMARATGAGAYSRNSLGIVIAFGMIVSTVLGRFVIPIYYVLGERVIDFFAGLGRGEGGTGEHRHEDEVASGLHERAIDWPGRRRRGIPVPAEAETSGD